MKLFVVAMLILAMTVIGSAQVSKDLSDLADAERAFAAETVKVGFRDGFAKFFADDGIGFGPHPERTREKLLKSPPATGPRKVIFNWAPMFGDISAAGDMGYTTGPVLFTPQGPDAKPPFHGIYFSVWQKQVDGSWKVAIDLGVDTPSAVAAIDTKFATASLNERDSKYKSRPMRVDDLRGLDEALSNSISTKSMAISYAKYLDRREFRIHRKGQMPVTNEDELAKVLGSGDRFEFIGGKAASSGDLAFTYGKYVSATNGPTVEEGYYVHVWRRNESGEWKLVADVQNPLPK
ncbi:MAG: nuclear transport factor 2 family protein [Pyrinomonadaceae bacterium]